MDKDSLLNYIEDLKQRYSNYDEFVQKLNEILSSDLSFLEIQEKLSEIEDINNLPPVIMDEVEDLHETVSEVIETTIEESNQTIDEIISGEPAIKNAEEIEVPKEVVNPKELEVEGLSLDFNGEEYETVIQVDNGDTIEDVTTKLMELKEAGISATAIINGVTLSNSGIETKEELCELYTSSLMKEVVEENTYSQTFEGSSSVPYEEVLQNPSLSAQTFSEGNKDLENVLLTCFGMGIATRACCAGHKNDNRDPYISFTINEQNEPYINNMMIQMSELGYEFKFKKVDDKLSSMAIYSKGDANELFKNIGSVVSSTDVTHDYYSELPKDLVEVRNIMDNDTFGDTQPLEIDYKNNDGNYNYRILSSMDNYVEYATNIGMEVGDDFLGVKPCTLQTGSRELASMQLEYIVSNVEKFNVSYNAIHKRSPNTKEAVQNMEAKNAEELCAIYDAYALADNSSLNVDVIVEKPIDKTAEREVTIFHPGVKDEVRAKVKFNDAEVFDNEVLPELTEKVIETSPVDTDILEDEHSMDGDAKTSHYMATQLNNNEFSLINMPSTVVAQTEEKANALSKAGKQTLAYRYDEMAGYTNVTLISFIVGIAVGLVLSVIYIFIWIK